MLLLQQLLCLMVDVDWMEHGERQYLVGEVELDGENEREERMEEESSSSEEINDAPSSPVTLERLSVEEQEIWTDLFEGIETKEDGQPDSPPALQLPLEEEVYDEVYEPEEAEHSGMKTPVKEDHSQRGEEDEIEGAEAIGEEAVVIWTEGPDGNESENDEEELEGMAHIVEKEDGSFTVVREYPYRTGPFQDYILPERGPLLVILDGDEEEHTYSDGDDSEGTIAWDSEDDVEENADGISDGDESDGTIFLDSDDDDVDMKMAEPKLENGPTGQEKKNTVEQTVDPDDVLMDGVINGLKKLEQEKARQLKASQQKVVVEEEEEQRPSTSHQLAPLPAASPLPDNEDVDLDYGDYDLDTDEGIEVRRVKEKDGSFSQDEVGEEAEQGPSTSIQRAPLPAAYPLLDNNVIDLSSDEETDNDSEMEDKEAELGPSTSTRQAPKRRPLYCRKCGGHGERRLMKKCGQWGGVVTNWNQFKIRCPYRKCRCRKCKKVNKERERNRRYRKVRKEKENYSYKTKR